MLLAASGRVGCMRGGRRGSVPAGEVRMSHTPPPRHAVVFVAHRAQARGRRRAAQGFQEGRSTATWCVMMAG